MGRNLFVLIPLFCILDKDISLDSLEFEERYGI